MKNIIENALAIATEAHKDQFRKWGSQAPYITHPIRCVEKAKELGLPEYVQAAMALHDVVEDIAIPTNTIKMWEDRIREGCGQDVLDLVWELTNPSDRPEFLAANPNPKRIEEWNANLEHIKHCSEVAKICKMIDRNDNISSTEDAPARWRQKYLPESRELLAACKDIRNSDQVSYIGFQLANNLISIELEASIDRMAKL